jgi:hypothetical protein
MARLEKPVVPTWGDLTKGKYSTLVRREIDKE